MSITFSKLPIRKISLFVAIASWVVMLLGELWEQYYWAEFHGFQNIPLFVKGLFINFFVVGSYLYAEKTFPLEDIDFSELIWKVFIFTVLVTIVSGVDNLLLMILDQNNQASFIFLETVFFQIEFGFFIGILATTFSIWKRMILYDRNKQTEKWWIKFELFLFLLLATHLFKFELEHWLFQVLFGLIILWILILSTNVRWMLQLNFSQKLRTIGQMLVLLICLSYLFFSLNEYYKNELLLIDEIYRSLFSSVVMAFVLIYGVASLLFLIFHLPTSQAIEKKLSDFSLVQLLSESIIEGKTEKEVLSIFFESVFSILQADAGCLVLSEGRTYFQKNLNDTELAGIMQFLSPHLGTTVPQRLTFSRFLEKKRGSSFNSYFVMPFGSEINLEGKLILAKKIHYGFDKTMERMAQSLASQAEMAIHNLRLLAQVIEHNRVKNELEIARKVHKQLLPSVAAISKNLNLKIEVFSESANEVGGDYYDFYQPSDVELMLIIADVAGNGISSAFNMAQMKGIFQTIVRQHLSVEKFMAQANAALSGCLPRNSFITASYFHIHTTLKTITFSRAGHCPALYFNAQDKSVVYLESTGVGLGIIRNASYEKYVAKDAFTYEHGDMLLLYTDGLVEAKNVANETYGFERLKNFFEQYCLSSHNLPFASLILQELNVFTQSSLIADDFTVMLIRL